MLEEFDIVNGIPRGSAISHIQFNIMINYIFMNAGGNIGSSLYPEDIVIWKRGKHIRHVMNCIQEITLKVERWLYDWGLKMWVTKACYMTLTVRRSELNI